MSNYGFLVPDRYIAHHGANEKMVKSVKTVTEGCCHACLQPPHLWCVAHKNRSSNPTKKKAKNRRTVLFDTGPHKKPPALPEVMITQCSVCSILFINDLICCNNVSS